MEWVRDGNWSVWEVLEMDLDSVGDLGRRVFVEIRKKGFKVRVCGRE